MSAALMTPTTTPAPTGSARDGAVTVLHLFLGRVFADRRVWVLPVAAFAVVSALGLSVAGGVGYFFSIDNDRAETYRVLAILAVLLLVLPMAQLAASAARLLARRRDERLSSLRLVGASSSTLRLLAVAESSAFAAVGSALGVVGYLMLMPLAGLLRFDGGPIGVAGMWLGVPGTALVLLAIIAIAVVSSLVGLRRIEITPLGVRTRARPARVHWLRFVIAGVLIVAAQLMANAVGAQTIAMVVTMILAALAVPMVALHFIGPWLIALITRRKLRRANTVEALVSARAVLESPQQAWAQIGGVALTTYIGVVGGAGMSLVNAASAGPLPPEELNLTVDLRTGVLLTMVIAFLLTACSVAITQAAQVLDRAELYRGLQRIGMGRSQLEQMRRDAVFGPLWIVLIFTLVVAGITALPVLGLAAIFSPVSMAIVALCLALGIVLVRGGVAVGNALQ
ncbi:permease [Citricoccus muralis]|uniref:Permease n=1 Tax=Citricoccus muralis TaxID=169134 RepID=A0ABY8H5R7_9MICC|nr:permease [Citricoccus muralis]WFP16479.1 permease [Citricoccus muralis]